MLIKIKAKTKAKKEVVNKKSEDSYVISVKEPAEENSANERILEILKRLFPRRALRIVKGHHSPSKIVEIA